MRTPDDGNAQREEEESGFDCSEHQEVANQFIERLQQLRDATGVLLPEEVSEIADNPELTKRLEDFLRWRSRSAHRAAWLTIFQKAAEKEIRGFVKSHFPSATLKDTEWIVGRIIRERDDLRRWGDRSLAELLNGGIKLVRKTRRWQRLPLRRIVSLAGVLVFWLLAVLVIAYLYSALSSEFETIVISLLLLIWVGIDAKRVQDSRVTLLDLFTDIYHYEKTLQVLGSTLNAEETKERFELAEKLDRAALDSLINGLGQSVVFLIAAWHILKVAWRHFSG